MFTARPDRRKMTDWVCDELREAIVNLRLRPGEPLREAALAEKLGVSKTPLREAFARLEQEGLVETTSFKGAVVTGYSERDLKEIYELRALLEGAAARAASEHATTRAIVELRDVLDRSRELRDAGDLVGLAELLGQFDVIVYSQVTNERIGAADRESPGASHADREAHRGHPRAVSRPPSRSTPRSSTRSSRATPTRRSD